MHSLVRIIMSAMLLSGGASATALLGRSSTMNKPFQLFGWTNFGYNQTAISYDTTAAKYVALAEDSKTTTGSCDVTLALGLPGRFDLDVVLPLAMKQQDTMKSTGLGDLMAYARYGLLQSPLLPVKAALILGANLPTADTTLPKAVRLSDRTVDVAFGVSANTQKYFGFLGHARAAYWLNGKTNDTTKVGNTFEYVLCADYSVTKTLTPELALSGYTKDKTRHSGVPENNTEVSQHIVTALMMWKPIPMLTIRPKASLPLTSVSKGSSMANIYWGLDIWATFPN